MGQLETLLKGAFGDAPRLEAKRAAFISELRGVSDSSRTIEFVASTERKDRYGDVVRVAGWKTNEYMRNPVFLWAHRSSDPPIGKVVAISKEANPAALVARVQFADAETYPFADQIYRLYKAGHLKSVSVGFRPLEDPKPVMDQESGRMTGYEFTSQELLELSAVPVPANADCVSRAVNAGIVCSAEAEKFFGRSDSPHASEAEIIAKLAADPEALARELLLMRREFAEFIDIFGGHLRETKRLFEIVRKLVPQEKRETLESFIQSKLVQ